MNLRVEGARAAPARRAHRAGKNGVDPLGGGVSPSSPV